ncbi:MAG TPA: type II toxin-antitoxin system Phd/YefM family antitoxin [Acidobacteriaceae bacterium]|nr:type II toxin-antitoxin system Phd/YefM family antitoxin [Acidobacteriaceae bacterium]
MKTLGATEAKTHFLSLLTDVEQKREGLIVTRNGKPVARVLPMPEPDPDPIYGFYRGKLEIKGDVLSPIYSDEELEEFFERSAAQYK